MSNLLAFGRWPLGVGDVCFKPRVDNYEAARHAEKAGFSHLRTLDVAHSLDSL